MTKSHSTRLMLGGATAALALALLLPAPVHAQSAFQGTPTNVPAGTFVTQSQLVDTITVTTPQSIIDWEIDNPPPGNFVFLPQGRTGRFVGFAPFTVLNRILPVDGSGAPISRLIELNGTITSEIDLTNQNGGIVRGGSVWFYSAGGILVGGSAVINVGSLVLTSNEVNTAGGLFGPGGEIRFAGTAASGPVTVTNGAQITARNPANPGSSYIALVAPRVVQGGTINADGSTALVAAQAADIGINAGLFDIQVTVGTDDPNGIVHTGFTGGPEDTTSANASRVYMVAVPRNTAIEMLLSGTVGFQTAVASQAGDAIVISSGRSILAGAVSGQPSGSGIASNIRMGDLISFNGLDAFAEGDISVESAVTACNGCRIFDITGSARLFATNAVRMVAGRGQEIRVAGSLLLRADDNGQGGTVSITADRSGPGAANAGLAGGFVNVFGDLIVDARGLGVSGSALDGDGQGGSATLTADGGNFLATNIIVDASGLGDLTDAQLGAAGLGGTATLLARNGGEIRARSANVFADGFGGGISINPATGLEQASRVGGLGRGGTALARVETSGSIILQPFSVGVAPLTVSASGYGSVGAIEDGDGIGGLRAAVEIADAASTISASSVTILAEGIAGLNAARNLIVTGITGGDGTGGVAELLLFGNLTTSFVTLDASGRGSDVVGNPQIPNAPTPTGGNATGGRATVDIRAAANLPVADLVVRADARGGNALGLTGVGGNAMAGTAILSLNNTSQSTVTNLIITANGTGGGGGDTSGDGRGGFASISTPPGTQLRITDLILQAIGIGGGATPFGNAPFLTTQGGDGFGGIVNVTTGGLFDLAGALRMEAFAVGGAGVATPGDARASQDGNATGGEANLLNLCFGCALTRANGFILDVTAQSDTGDGQAGNAQGGRAFLTISTDGAALESSNGISLLASANAGFGTTGGDARGGFVGVSTTSGDISALGGGALNAIVDATGATATGGQARVQAGQDGAIRAGAITLSATATGSTTATGGRAELVSSATGLPASAATINATGAVTLATGATAIGGTANGGFAIAWADGGIIETNGNALTVDASATGDVGNAGTASLYATDNGGAAAIRAGAVNVTADGTVAGRIELFDTSTGQGMAFTSLNAYARGLDAGPLGGIYVQTSNGPITAAGAINFESAGDIDILASNSGGLSAGGALTLASRRSIRGTHTGAAGPTVQGATIDMQADLDVDFGPEARIVGDGNVFLSGLRNVLATSTTSLTDNIEMIGGSVSAGDAIAAGRLTITATGSALLQNGQSGGTTSITAADITVFNAVTTGNGTPSDIELTATGDTALGTLNSAGNVTITSGTLSGAASGVTAAQMITATTTGNAGFGTMAGATGVTVTSGGTINGQSATSGGGNVLLTANGNIGFGAVNAGGAATLRSVTGLILADAIDAVGLATLDAATFINVGRVTSTGNAVAITSGGDAIVQDAAALTTITMLTGGDARLGNGLSGGTTRVSGRNVSVGTARTTGPGSDILIDATQSASPVTLNAARNITINAATLFSTGGTFSAGGQIVVTTTGNADFGSMTSAGGVTVTSGGYILGQSATATGAGANVTLSAADFLRMTNVRSTLGAVNMIARTALVDDIFGGTAVDVTTTQDLTLTNTQSGGTVTLRSTGGGATATTVNAVGNVTVNAATAALGSTVTSTGGSIAFTGTNSAGIGTANAATTLTIQSGGTVNLTNGTSGGNTLLTGFDVIVQNARTTGAVADLVLNATRTAALGTANAGRDIRITGPSAIQLFGTTQTAGRDVNLNAGNLFNDGAGVFAGRAISATTVGSAALGSMTAADNVTIFSGQVTGGTVRTTNVNSVIDILSGGALTLTSANSGGSASLRSSGDAVSVGTVDTVGAASLNAATSIATTRITSTGGSIAAIAGNGATIGTASAAMTLNVQAGTGTASLTNGTSGGTMTITGNAVTLGSATTTGAAADILLTANQAVTLGTLNAARDISVNAATLGGMSSSLTAGRALTVSTSGDTTFGAAQAAGALNVTSGGALSGTSARSTGGPVTLSGANGVAVAAVQSGGTTSLVAANGAIVVGDLQSVGLAAANGRSVQISTRGGVTFSALTATAGDARVTAATGDLTVTNGNASGALALTTTLGNLTTGQLNAATIALTSNGLATLNGTTTATGSLGIDARGNAAINAAVTGATMTVRSGNIAIAATGRLGAAGTTTALTLSNTDISSRTFIGGADITTGYSLSAAEMLRLFGGNITINAPRAQTQGGPTLGSNRPPDVVIGAFTLQGGATTAGNLGANGNLTIDTPGSARVVGAVALEGMSASNRFLLSATEAIEVIAGQGSVRMTNGAALSGILDLRSDDIAVATSAAITAIAGLTDIDLIDDRLGESDGIVSDDGMLAAAGIRMTVRNGVYIQNTGTGTRFGDRRGFTTGAGGLTITTAGPATRIVINGRIPNAAGTFATGRDTIPLITIAAGGPTAGVGQFDQGSTANGCLIANPAACFEGDGVPPVQDIVDLTGGPADSEIDTQFALLIELRDVEPLPNEPLIDDPVTGTGNDDLWEAPCEPAEGQETCP